ncbi:MAG: tRNA (adenosine(37)-N6)-threonylcarbamoyltransferase complex ATPase subunit type 1 TsaE [Pseudomonadota bacterium]
MKAISHSEAETIEIARSLAPKLKSGDVVLLHGTLGMGKTVFARALIRALTQNAELEVPSPTFTLVQTYEAPECSLYHYDLYRIEDPNEILELGWEDALHDSISIVEWPDRLGAFKPSGALDITLSNIENDANAREILIERNE